MLETIPLILQSDQSLRGLNCISCPKDVETDDLCSSPQTPSSQLERGCVSIYFRVSPCPLFKIQTLCRPFCLRCCRFFFFFKPPTSCNFGETLYLAEDSIWKYSQRGNQNRQEEILREAIGPLGFLYCPFLGSAAG